MSPHLSSRPSARRRSSSESNPKSVALTPWHVVGIGLIAVLGTGIVAAVDRLQQGAAAARAGMRPLSVKTDGAKTAKISEAPPPAPAVEARRPPPPSAPPFPSPPQATVPASAPGRDNAAHAAPPVQGIATETAAIQHAMPSRFLAAFAEHASFPATPPPTPPAVTERAPRNVASPAATASVPPPLPPVRQPATDAPQAPSAKGGLKVGAAAPTECLPNGLRAVLADVAARFGDITIVSTHQLNTGNHSPGSIREKLHHACNAVDFRPGRDHVEEVKKYLRGRPEIGGVESYRNGVVHVDLKGSEVASAGGRGQAAAQTASAALQTPAAPPQAAEPSGLFRLFGR